MTKDLNKHEINLSYNILLKKDTTRNDILPRARANYFLMSPKETQMCKTEIEGLLNQGIIQNSSSSFSCHAMYVSKFD